jgi:ABC-2 type transport system ATP-binding protein
MSTVAATAPIADAKSAALAIRTENLTRRFGDFTAVDKVNLQIAKGEIFGFLGPNGSGKTTVIKMLTGLLPITDGAAWVDGLDVRTELDTVRERIGYMSQQVSLYDDLTARENLTFYGRIYNLSQQHLLSRIDTVVEQNSLAPYLDRRASQLSGGWRQRLALACSMLHEPKILFLDEPTAGIDPVARRELWDLLFALAAQGTTFFITTHYMDEAERCSHVAYIYFASLIANGTPAELKAMPEISPPGTARVEITSVQVTRALAVLRKLPGVISATVFGQSVHALIEDRLSHEALTAALAKENIPVGDIRPLAVSLEDVFVEMSYRRESERNQKEAERSAPHA